MTEGEQAFEELVSNHYASLYRFALSLAHNESDASDLAQQTFYCWAAKGGSLRDKSKAKSWLFTTLYREFLQRQRRVTRFPHYELSEVQEGLPQVEASSTYADRSIALHALSRIDPDFRAVVALFYLEDYSQQEIADILGIPIGTVKSRISRGVGQLQRELSQAGKSGGAKKPMIE